MAVDPAVQDFIARSMAENNRSLMSEISTLITSSVESIKRSNSEAAKSYLESNAVDKAKESLTEGTSLLTERQKLILLADKSEFGWKTVQEYTQHELAEDDQDGKKIRRAEERAEKSLKSVAAKRSKKQGGFPSSPSRPQSSRVPFQRSSSFTSWRYRQPFYSRSIADLPSKPGSCLPAENLVIGGLNVRWFVLLLLLNLEPLNLQNPTFLSFSLFR
ncbi:unnamed protein product [Porites lobata]|uniref:Uncharacterized protein n=1 Tax=Porites lobata TaxID=104759 RepID=A0ABN8RYK1_9CNID|nr:unnamed protein product [Porites lobata]